MAKVKGKLTKRQEEIYWQMRYEALRGFEHFNNWDWTITTYWHEQERPFDYPAIKAKVESEIRSNEFNFSYGFTKEDQYRKNGELLQQVLKFCNERIEILKNL